eukprot:5654892-Amphidinium_carterae.1
MQGGSEMQKRVTLSAEWRGQEGVCNRREPRAIKLTSKTYPFYKPGLRNSPAFSNAACNLSSEQATRQMEQILRNDPTRPSHPQPWER